MKETESTELGLYDERQYFAMLNFLLDNMKFVGSSIRPYTYGIIDVYEFQDGGVTVYLEGVFQLNELDTSYQDTTDIRRRFLNPIIKTVSSNPEDEKNTLETLVKKCKEFKFDFRVEKEEVLFRIDQIEKSRRS